jgi:hypothetical protein
MPNRLVVSLIAIVSLSVAAAEEKEKVKREKVRIGPVTYEVPTSWQRERPTSEMRVVQYSLPKEKGDNEKVVFIVFYFGGQGGSVSENFKRWRGMFEDKKDEGKTDQFEVGGLKISTLDISGTYLDRPAPFAPEATPRKNYRMLAAVVETPDDGPYYFRLVGSAKSVAVHVEHWKHMLKTASTN